MILEKEDLIKTEKEGKLEIKDRLEFSSFSLDIRIGKLFKPKLALCFDESSHNMDEEEFIEKMLDEVPLPKEGKVIDGFYLWQPKEEIYLANGLFAEIASRSSWARLGVRVEDTDERLKKVYEDSICKPLCTLRTMETKVLLKPGDALAQLFVHSSARYAEDNIVFLYQIKKFIDSGEFVMRKNSKKLDFSDLIFLNGVLMLTMNSKIKMYSGNVLIPGEPKDNDFEEMILKYDSPLLIKKDSFFLSSSEEYVGIPNDCCGKVRPNEFTFHPKIKLPILPFYSHANAPWIGPKRIFEGPITFENMTHYDSYFCAGMLQSGLNVFKLSKFCSDTKNSRYKNQDGATESRL